MRSFLAKSHSRTINRTWLFELPPTMSAHLKTRLPLLLAQLIVDAFTRDFSRAIIRRTERIRNGIFSLLPGFAE